MSIHMQNETTYFRQFAHKKSNIVFFNATDLPHKRLLYMVHLLTIVLRVDIQT